MSTILETRRLLLRGFLPSDLDALAPLYADPEVRRYFPDGTLDRDRTREELEWFLAGADPGRPGIVLGAIVEKTTGDFVGRAGFVAWDIDGRCEIEIAYMFRRERWREGLGGEIARGLVEHGLGRLGLPRLIALIHPENVASIRTARSAGLRFERELSIEGARCLLHAIGEGRAADDER